MNPFLNVIGQIEPPSSNPWAIERTAGPLLSQTAFWWVVGTIVATTLLLVLLARVPSNFRKPIIVLVTFASGAYYVLEWLIPKARTPEGKIVAPVVGFDWLEVLPVASSTSQILTAFLLILGVISIFRVNFGRLAKLQKDWFFSGVLLISMFVMIFFGFANFNSRRSLTYTLAEIDKAAEAKQMSDRWVSLGKLGVRADAETKRQTKYDQATSKLRIGEIQQPEYDALRLAAQTEHDTAVRDGEATVDAGAAGGEFPAPVVALVKGGARAEQSRSFAAQGNRLVFNNMLQVLDAATFSLIAFFILSAAFRAFRIRSIEATILMFTALIILLSFVPLGLAITDWLDADSFAGNYRIDSISDWILATLNTPAIRAINLGLALGVLAMGTRIMLGLEKGVSE